MFDTFQDGQPVALGPGGEQVILVGAASKGIIQRDYQHNAVVFRAPYAKNPFDEVRLPAVLLSV